MTIGITCNLSDGVIIGADSAITVSSPPVSQKGIITHDVLKVYSDAEKVFQLGKNSFVGILTYGAAIIAKRTIESYIRQFELDYKTKIEGAGLYNISGHIREFFYKLYMENIKGELEKIKGVPFEQIPDKEKPIIGIVVAGFSPDQPLSEAFEIKIPIHKKKNDINTLRKQGDFGTNWFGTIDPIRRFVKGFDIKLLNKLIGYFVEKKSVKFSESLEKDIQKILSDSEYIIPYDAMPLQEGINHVKFLLEMVINHNKFVIGAPICGGPMRIAVITQNDGFKLVTDNQLKLM